MLIHLSHLKVATVLAAGVLFAATVYLLEGKPSPSAPNVQSQQGTQVDIASDRDTFEYFLSTLGERSLDDIQVQYARFANTLSFGEQQQALFENTKNTGRHSVNCPHLPTKRSMSIFSPPCTGK